MSYRKCDKLRTWVLGAATTGLFWPSIPAIGQTGYAVVPNQKSIAGKNAAVQQTRTLPIPAGANTGAESVQQVSQTDGTPGDNRSEVQRQLEALYEQDGREMPGNMSFNLQPINPGATSTQQSASTNSATRPVQTTPQPAPKPVRSTQGHTQYQPRSQATPYPPQTSVQPPRTVSPAIETQMPSQVPSRPNAVTGFFKKLTRTHSNKPLSTEAPIPPDYVDQAQGIAANQVPSVPPASLPTAAISPVNQPTMRYAAPVPPTNQVGRSAMQPKLANANQNTNSNPASGNVQIVAGIRSTSSELAKPTLPLPPLAQQPLPIQGAPLPIENTTVPTALPPLMTEVQMPATSAPQVAKVGEPNGQAATDFPNPFPETTEVEADGKISSAKSAPAISPRSVPEVINKVDPIVTNPVVATPAEPVKEIEEESEPAALRSDEDPYAVEAKDFVEPSITEDVPPAIDPTAPSLGDQPAVAPLPFQEDKSVTEPKLIVESPAVDTRELRPASKAREPHMDKMRRIRERFGMKGLKGFCPVTLREERELVDARTEFHALHRNQKFHFASAEARDKFEANPFRYVPAAYGADVVALSRDKDVLEGTLDFAAWYKGRLYLFGSQSNCDTFTADPTQFATLEGIE